MNKKRCGAKKRNGEPCKKWPIRGRARCRLHGGKTLKGIDSPSWKNGRWSKYLPENLLGKYKEAQEDKELLVLRDEIALVDGCIAETIEQLDRDESGAIWRNLQAAGNEYKKAVSKGEKEEAGRMIDIILSLIAEGAQQIQIRREIVNLIDQRRKLVESERKRYVEMHQMITAEKVLNFVASMGALVRNRIKDRKIISLIMEDLRLLIEREGE